MLLAHFCTVKFCQSQMMFSYSNCYSIIFTVFKGIILSGETGILEFWGQ